MMWRHGRLFLPRCFGQVCGFWKKWTRRVLPICAAALLLTAQGCSYPSSTPALPTLPVLTSLQRLTLNGTPGIWMNSSDAGTLALWICNVTGDSSPWTR